MDWPFVTAGQNAKHIVEFVRGLSDDVPDDQAAAYIEGVLSDFLARNAAIQPQPIQLILTCPACGERHIDKGAFAAKPHKVHACQKCGLQWRPANVPTVGVQFLPGSKDRSA